MMLVKHTFDCLRVDSTRMCARDKVVVALFAWILAAIILCMVASLAYIIFLMLALVVLTLAVIIAPLMVVLLEDRSILLRLCYTELQYCEFGIE